MPEAIPVAPRRDDTAADVKSLVQLGRVDPPPVPAPTPGLPPTGGIPAPLPPSDSTDAKEMAALNSALAEAGVSATPEDQAAVQAIARLDAATVDAVTRWMKTKKPKPDTK